jgi:hypothetical protein
MQEEYEACEQIVQLCQQGLIRLIIPAYSIAEPYETQIRHQKRREELTKGFEYELKQIRRSQLYERELDLYSNFSDLLVRIDQEETQRLQQTQMRLLKFATLIPLSTSILIQSLDYQLHYRLSPQDAIILASVMEDINESNLPSCFLNRDANHFTNPDIMDLLVRKQCKILFRFEDGNKYIRSHL